jgi:hypothetical protein
MSRDRDRVVRRGAAMAVAGALALVPAARAQLVAVDLSNDLTWTAGAATIDDEGVARVTLPAVVSAISLGALPGAADVSAYHALDDGRALFALDTFVDLGGGVTAGPEDLVTWDGSAFALFLDGSGAGIPAGSGIDAVARRRQAGTAATLVSFDVTTLLPGGLTVEDEDLAAWDGVAWTSEFDGSGNGVPEALDLDGFDRDPENGTRYFSFDSSGQILGVDFDDEDVVAFDGFVWSLAFDASVALEASFAAGDLDALGARTANLFSDDFETQNLDEWSVHP